MPHRAIGHILRQRRLALGLTQVELAERVIADDEWLTQADISRIETGAVKLPRPERLQRLAEALDLSLADLLLYASGVDDAGQVVVEFPQVESSPEATPNLSPDGIWDDPRLHLRLLEDVQQAVIVTDADGTIRYWNAYAEQLYGWTANEVLGRDFVDVTVPGAVERQAQAEAIRSHLAAGQHWSGEFLVRKRDCTPFRAQVTLSPVLDRNGAVVAVFGTSHAVAGSHLTMSG